MWYPKTQFLRKFCFLGIQVRHQARSFVPVLMLQHTYTLISYFRLIVVVDELPDTVEQRNTILNLYDSGIDTEIIALKLDIDQNIVLEVKKMRTKKNKENF